MYVVQLLVWIINFFKHLNFRNYSSLRTHHVKQRFRRCSKGSPVSGFSFECLFRFTVNVFTGDFIFTPQPEQAGAACTMRNTTDLSLCTP
jgi:hypothetical protein